jgi:DNA segregation ATPase FtsK/SpoIIIE, S-DNA-T family
VNKKKSGKKKVRNPHIAKSVGIAIILLCLFLLVAIMSYSNIDPSFNKATNGKINNMAGGFGAFISDPLLYVFGLGSLMLIIVPITWGLTIIKNGFLPDRMLRSACLAASVLFASSFFATFDSITVSRFHSWPFITNDYGDTSYISFGGLLGGFALEILRPLITVLPYALIFLALMCITTYYASTLTVATWKWLLHKIAFGAIFPFIWLYRKITPPTPDIAAIYDEDDEDDGDEIDGEQDEEKPAKKKKSRRRNIRHIEEEFDLPTLDMLQTPKASKNKHNEAALYKSAEVLEGVLADYGVKGDIKDVAPGPVITLYSLEPEAGTKASRVIGLADDIARSLSATSARIAVIAGTNTIGIELPNTSRETVYLFDLLNGNDYKNGEHILPLALGKDIGGKPVVMDLAKAPHLLVAGTTGSGKSVGINAMVLSLLFKYTPEQCRLIMIDPKMVELSIYQDIPHLLTPVIVDAPKAIVALKWAVREMENRYRLLASLGVRNIYGYNDKIAELERSGEQLSRQVQNGVDEDGIPIIEEVPIPNDKMPFIVVFIDEVADLMLQAGKEVEICVQRLAQMGRASGVHLIMATQRPSVDVITGTIKSNFPTRISFKLATKIDSRTILNEQGAEQLLGQGDMLYSSGGGRMQRVHGPFVSEEEIEKVVAHLKAQAQPNYQEDITYAGDEGDEGGVASFGGDNLADSDLYKKAVAVVRDSGNPTVSYLQRVLKIGYNKSANFIEQMEKDGYISAPDHRKKRQVLK